jgi:hypothetical protein
MLFLFPQMAQIFADMFLRKSAKSAGDRIYLFATILNSFSFSSCSFGSNFAT